MKYIADLHVHSKFSMATAKNLDLENLYIAAQLKGITVVGTGDITHPGWMAEVGEKLVPAEEGLYKLKDEIAEQCDRKVPPICRRQVRFILVSEISSIYKKKDKVRKNHNLVFLPDLCSTESFNAKLDKIGNIRSDGRPILGLDARNLLEILLESSENAFLIPAHIWTPWFSVLGSKSGFDSVEECFDDLFPYIFAVETGLSSDPPMNWRVKSLDGLTLVSNSDAHSPMKLGREANIFNTQISFPAIKAALKSGDPNSFLGTFEFYPEEGKYHIDGHRKCQVSMMPEKTIKAEGICPVCKKPLTIGVLYRVEELSDRPSGEKPDIHHPFYRIVPLTDILANIHKVGPNTKKVTNSYHKALAGLGSEFSILNELAIDKISKIDIPLLGEAIQLVRGNKINIIPGFDGEFGKVEIFSDKMREKLLGQKTFFSAIPSSQPKKKYDKKSLTEIKRKYLSNKNKSKLKQINRSDQKILDGLNKKQEKAVKNAKGHVLIVAGPGTGKTRTLTHKIAYLIKEKKVAPCNILAVTFTTKAALEMKERLLLLLGQTKQMPCCVTFHSLCYRILNESADQMPISVIDDKDRLYFLKTAIKQVEKSSAWKIPDPKKIIEKIVAQKQGITNKKYATTSNAIVDTSKDKQLEKVLAVYDNLLSIQHLVDYDDLIAKVAYLLENNKLYKKKYQNIYKYIFVDEYQDLNPGQYAIIKALVSPETDLCAIGDPNQLIYGFRGSDMKFFNIFIDDFPNALLVRLRKNYRSTQTILDASFQALKSNEDVDENTRIYSDIKGINTISVVETATEKAEAVYVGKCIEQMVGGMGFYSVDFDKVETTCKTPERGFADFAILYRTHSQGKIIYDILTKAGIPCIIANKKSIYDNNSVAKLISLLKVIEDKGTYADLAKVCKIKGLGLGEKSLDLFVNWSIKHQFTLSESLSNTDKARQKALKNINSKINAFTEKLSGFKKVLQNKTVEDKLLYLIDNTEILINAKENATTKDAIESVLNKSVSFGDNADRFFSHIALLNDTDIYEPMSEKVTLMTFHAAKGLEFPIVFITGCEQNIIPFKRLADDGYDFEEEKRLFYVAMTRAKDLLYLTYAKKRLIYGKVMQQTVSPFVNDIEKRLKNYGIINKKKPKKKKDMQLTLFD